MTDILESIALPRFRRLYVAQRESPDVTHYFVLRGRRDQHPAAYAVEGPYASLHDARNQAHALQLAVYAGEREAS